MKTCLVTGGAGFIGSNMAVRLQSLGHRVIVLDDESTGCRDNVPDGAEYFLGDVTKPTDVAKVFDQGIDAVFHIAGRASTIKAFHDPEGDLNVNVRGTLNVLAQCIKHKVPRLLYASSMTSYGHPEQMPTPETTVCRPISYYGVTKYAAERYVHATAERNDLGFDFHVTSFRMFNVYGPRQSLTNPYQGVAAIFIGNILRGEPITIFGDGDQSRDFVYIDDVVNAWVSAMDESKTFGQVFNLGGGARVSVNQLVDSILVAFALDRSSYNVVHDVVRPGDQRHMQAEIAKLCEALDWRPLTSFQNGMNRTISWARECAAGNKVG